MARMRYVVTGGTGFIGRRVVSRILGRVPRRRGLGAGPPGVAGAVRAAGRRGRPPWGDRAKALVGDLTADRARPLRRHHRRARRRRPHGALRRHLRHHRRRGCTARRERGRHPGGDRPGPPTRRDAASRVVDRGGRQLSRRIHRGRLRRRAGPADALSPDQVRGRTAGPLGARAALPDLPAGGGRRRLAHRRNGQGRRPVLLLRPSWRSWPCCPRSPRSCCPTPAAPTSFRSTTSSMR